MTLLLTVALSHLLNINAMICFTGGDEWEIVAERLGLSQAHIRCFDKRFPNPFEIALRCCQLTVGKLYDVLVECGFPVLADLL